jgi:DNA-binding MarR family transcriptional regulator
VDRLLMKGLVRKNTSKADKRLVEVYITDEGKTLLAKLDQQNELMDSVIKGLSEDEMIIFNNLLDKIRA